MGIVNCKITSQKNPQINSEHESTAFSISGVDDEVKAMVEQLKSKVQEKSQAMGRNGFILELECVEVMTQVVAGVNYFIKVR